MRGTEHVLHARLLRVVRFCVLSIAMLLTVVCKPLVAQNTSANEDDIRAAMVMHLTLFVEWPAWKMDVKHPQFFVCLLGVDPISKALENVFLNRTVGSKPVVLRHVISSDNLEACHILYICTSAKRDVVKQLPVLQSGAVLTVSERSSSNSPGQIVGFPTEDDHVRIDINLRDAQLSKLIISSRLLHIATLVQ